MTVARPPWTKAFSSPSRAAILYIAFVAATVSVVPAFWILPFIGGVMVLFSSRLPMLRQVASMKFIIVVTSLVTLTTLPRGPLSQVFAAVRIQSILVVTSAVLILILASRRLLRGQRLGGLEWTVVMAWVLGAGAVAILADPEPWIDVWRLHGDAADAIREGVTPYSGRQLPNPMSWFPEGSVYGGYVYPPIVLTAYAGADLLFGDSRWIALAAGVVLVLSVRKLSSTATSDAVGLMLLLAPGWPLMTQLAWTEVLSVALIGLVAASQSQSVQALLVGAFIASKQYLLLFSIPVTSSWLGRRNRELWIAGSCALALYAVGTIFGAPGYFEWVFRFHMTAPPVDLGASLPGLAYMLFQYSIVVPLAVSLPIAVVTGWLLARRTPRTDGSMLLAGTTMIAAFFFLGSQSFPNYWYLILGGLVFSHLVLAREEQVDEGAHSTPEFASEFK